MSQSPVNVSSHVVVANWKMHGNLQKNALLIDQYLSQINNLQRTKVIICPPYPYLAQMQSLLKNTPIAWGAQNMGKYEQGAYTGEVSAEMLCDFGCQYVILGHSERSTAYCESDENIAEKFFLAKQYGLTPILCVGETLIEREAGVMEMVVGKQLDTVIRMCGVEVFGSAMISYEPIWAIGTGLAATPDQAQAMHGFIRGKLASLNQEVANSVKILYGGSVNPQNALQLLHAEGVDGGLVGKCSLSAQDFIKICHSADQLP
jgi:triosephosphate isomerase (TIM)